MRQPAENAARSLARSVGNATCVTDCMVAHKEWKEANWSGGGGALLVVSREEEDAFARPRTKSRTRAATR